jgi:DNA-binding winged helix-turn-helix (wHTH) protein
MRVLIVGGKREHSDQLARIAVGAGLELEIERISPPHATLLDTGRDRGASDEGGGEQRPLALVFEALDRPELAVASLGVIKNHAVFEDVSAIVVVVPGQVARLGGVGGFDDFMLHPYAAEELDGRLRSLAGRGTRREAEDIVVDRDGQEVRIEGRNVPLTAKEFALLAYLCERRGRVFSREHLLDRVWGSHYAVGSRTVDIHVRRLRAKLGSALPLETLRGRGYKLRREASRAPEYAGMTLGLASE